MMSQLGRPIMSKDLSNHTRHASDTPAVKRGSPNLAARDRHDSLKPFRTLSATPSGMSSLHDNKRTGQWRPLARTIAKSVSHLRMFGSTPGLVEPARSLPQGKTNRKAGATPRFGGARRDRTDDLKLAKLALSQLSYGPNSVTSTQTKDWLA